MGKKRNILHILGGGGGATIFPLSPIYINHFLTNTYIGCDRNSRKNVEAIAELKKLTVSQFIASMQVTSAAKYI